MIFDFSQKFSSYNSVWIRVRIRIRTFFSDSDSDPAKTFGLFRIRIHNTGTGTGILGYAYPCTKNLAGKSKIVPILNFFFKGFKMYPICIIIGYKSAFFFFYLTSTGIVPLIICSSHFKQKLIWNRLKTVQLLNKSRNSQYRYRYCSLKSFIRKIDIFCSISDALSIKR
jgi:hypothetical protein